MSSNISFPELGKNGWPWVKKASEYAYVDQRKHFDGPWPKISIVTPSFNQADYIEETILSIIFQDYPNLEFIVIDGGSIDGSIDTIDKYESSIDYWISEPDRGSGDAIAKGFNRATGDIFVWLNTDDLLLPGALHTVARKFMISPSTDWIIGEAIEIDSESGLLRPWFSPQIHYSTLLFSGCWFHQPASFWRRSIYNKVEGFDSTFQFAYDYDLFLRMAAITRPVMIRQFLAAFRFHSKSKTMTMPHVCRSDMAILQERHGAGKYPLVFRNLFKELFLRYVDRMNQLKRWMWQRSQYV